MLILFPNPSGATDSTGESVTDLHNSVSRSRWHNPRLSPLSEARNRTRPQQTTLPRHCISSSSKEEEEKKKLKNLNVSTRILPLSSEVFVQLHHLRGTQTHSRPHSNTRESSVQGDGTSPPTHRSRRTHTHSLSSDLIFSSFFFCKYQVYLFFLFFWGQLQALFSLSTTF